MQQLNSKSQSWNSDQSRKQFSKFSKIHKNLDDLRQQEKMDNFLNQNSRVNDSQYQSFIINQQKKTNQINLKQKNQNSLAKPSNLSSNEYDRELTKKNERGDSADFIQVDQILPPQISKFHMTSSKQIFAQSTWQDQSFKIITEHQNSNIIEDTKINEKQNNQNRWLEPLDDQKQLFSFNASFSIENNQDVDQFYKISHQPQLDQILKNGYKIHPDIKKAEQLLQSTQYPEDIKDLKEQIKDICLIVFRFFLHFQHLEISKEFKKRYIQLIREPESFSFDNLIGKIQQMLKLGFPEITEISEVWEKVKNFYQTVKEIAKRSGKELFYFLNFTACLLFRLIYEFWRRGTIKRQDSWNQNEGNQTYILSLICYIDSALIAVVELNHFPNNTKKDKEEGQNTKDPDQNQWIGFLTKALTNARLIFKIVSPLIKTDPDQFAEEKKKIIPILV